MSDIGIAPDDPRAPGLLPLIEALDAYLNALYPAISNHIMDLEELCAPEVTLLTARRGGHPDGPPLALAALVGHGNEKPPYGELKRMYVLPEARGLGLAKRLLLEIEALARAKGLTSLKLETGIHQPEALALYRRHGFTERGPFGSYVLDPMSLFMEKGV